MLCTSVAQIFRRTGTFNYGQMKEMEMKEIGELVANLLLYLDKQAGISERG